VAVALARKRPAQGVRVPVAARPAGPEVMAVVMVVAVVMTVPEEAALELTVGLLAPRWARVACRWGER
jgi:hypothetical protein